MRLGENTFKKYLIRTMGRRWDVQSHEDKYSEGIPDLSYGIGGVNGWIELKYLPEWPLRNDVYVKPDRFTANQVNWLISRGKKGGKCFIFIKIGDEYFLFDWTLARHIRAGKKQPWYIENCIKVWYKSINPSELSRILRSRH